jgi:hypothetical protein
MLGALGYMLYRAAREIAKLGIGVSIAFAVLAIAVLVALPIGLYMLSVPRSPRAEELPELAGKPTAFIEELVSAGRGVIALIRATARRRAISTSACAD